MATISAIPSTRITGGSFLLEERKVDEVFTPEDFTEQHHLIGQTAEEFAANEILPNAEKMEHKDHSVSRDLLKKAGDLGLSGVEIPEAYGGLEMDKVTAAVIADHIAKYAGFATTWGAHSGIGTLPIVYFGTEEQKKKYLPRLAAGEIVGAYALSEASSGSDALNCRARAQLSPDGKHYILNGEKMWITNGGFADLFADVRRSGRRKVQRRFMVERRRSLGFSVGAGRAHDGHARLFHLPVLNSGMTARFPVENVLGEIGKGHQHRFQHSERRPVEAWSGSGVWVRGEAVAGERPLPTLSSVKAVRRSRFRRLRPGPGRSWRRWRLMVVRRRVRWCIGPSGMIGRGA